MTKNCDDCIKNNRKPNAVGCIECSVVKKKKKKIGDLTLKEITKMNCPTSSCNNCPFWQYDFDTLADKCCDLVNSLDEFHLLDQEIEVEE